MKVTLYDLELTDGMPHLVAESECDSRGYTNLNSPGDIAGFLDGVFRLSCKAEEHFVMIAMNAKGKPIGCFRIAKGTVNMAITSPREILIRLLLCGAVGFVVAHNHPSGDVTPSSEDRKLTKRLKEAGDIINTKLRDHVIVGEGHSFYSFYEHEKW